MQKILLKFFKHNLKQITRTGIIFNTLQSKVNMYRNHLLKCP